MRAIETTVGQSVEEVEPVVREALADEGFGVLTEVDVAATLAAKLGVQRPALRILGACNPQMAHQALETDPTVSLLLPCNVVLEAVPGGTRVAAADPTALLEHPDLGSLATEGADRLRRVMDVVSRSFEAAPER